MTIIRADGAVVADSDEDVSKMENHGDRTEIIEALETGDDPATRYNRSLQKNMMFAAQPIVFQGEIIGYSRASFPLTDVYLRMAQRRNVSIAAICAAATRALLLGFFLARRIVAPLERMNEFADSIAAGDFEKRIPAGGKYEFGQLTNALNSMAAQIGEGISRCERAEAELRKSGQFKNLFKLANDAILIFEPENEIVLNVNDKACEMYGLSREEFIGRSLKERSQNVSRGSEELEKLLQDGVYQEFESVHLRGDGTALNLVINAAVIEYENLPAIMMINRDVTAKKQIEENLRESEERFRSLARAAQDAIISADSRGKIIFWNEGAEKIFGYSETETIGQSLQMIMPAAQHKAHQKGLEKNVRTGENHLIGQTSEVPGRRKDGSDFPLELSLGKWKTVKGIFFTAVIRDITDRKFAETAVKESERRYRFLGEGIMHQVWTAQPDGKLDYVNGRTLDYFGISLEQVLNDGWKNVIHPEDLPTCVERWTQSLATGADYEVEFRLKKADGEYFWHLGRATAGRDSDGKIFKWFGTNSSIHTQKIVEEKLRDSESWLRAIFDGSRDGILIEDNSKIIYVNNSYSQLLGYDAPGELIGRNISDILPPSEAERLREFGRQRLRGESVPSIYEFEGKRKDNTPIDLESSVSTTVIGGATYIVTAVRNITERKQIREELQKNVSRLASTLESTADGILLVDSSNKIVTFNKKFAEMWE